MKNTLTIGVLVLLLIVCVIFSSPIADLQALPNDQWPNNKKLDERTAKTFLKFRDENDVSKRILYNCQKAPEECAKDSGR